MPRVQMTTTVKVALFCLRLYLVLMLLLIAFKFVRDFSRSRHPASPADTATHSAPVTPSPGAPARPGSP